MLILYSFLISVVSFFALEILISSFGLFGLLKVGFIGEVSGFLRISAIFFIWTPAYFYILKNKWPFKSVIFNILLAFFVVSLVVIAINFLQRY